MMKYRCSHCNHQFELSDREFQRCPNCFWTTSLVPLEGGSEKMPASDPAVHSASKSSPKRSMPKEFIFFLVALVGIGVFSFVLVQNWGRVQSVWPKFSAQIQNQTPQKPESEKAIPKVKSQEILKLLTSEEQAELVRPFQITIPRQLSEDEEAILKKQVSPPAKLAEKPKLTPWKKEDFEKMLETEQKQRQILLGWWYVRGVTKIFEDHYPPAVVAFEKDDYAKARELFIKSLAFPVYRNDVKLHRAVALVMLRPYINDVIGKIATLNQYLIGQTLATDAKAIFESYQALFPVLELQEWNRALELITGLKQKIAAFENHPQGSQTQYPSAFGEIDAEIQSAIQAEAAPKPEGAVSLRAFVIDLDLKEKVVRQNTPEELSKVQKQYEQALQLLGEGNWQEAETALQSIEYPSELVADAKQKLALIEKALAFQEAGMKKSN
ncbi:MAG: zinc ribbon domain-containing protein [Candidatus Omnitrophica bacterium]|nr:zinc ribbon domain-containing protein [Candidatus Omnitrophota bacterium]